MNETKPEIMVMDWACTAVEHSGPDATRDCGWPICGCDPYAEKVIEALAESLIFKPEHSARDLWSLAKSNDLGPALIWRATGEELDALANLIQSLTGLTICRGDAETCDRFRGRIEHTCHIAKSMARITPANSDKSRADGFFAGFTEPDDTIDVEMAQALSYEIASVRQQECGKIADWLREDAREWDISDGRHAIADAIEQRQHDAALYPRSY